MRERWTPHTFPSGEWLRICWINQVPGLTTLENVCVQAYVREIALEIDQQELWNAAVLPTIP